MNQNQLASKERLQDKEFFAKMNEAQRQKYLKEMLKTPQVDGDLSKIKRVKFPKSETFEFQGFKLNYNYIEATTTPKAVLLYFHGMYCNSNNGGLLAEAISRKCNINVYGLDFLNAGKSQSDEQGYYKSMDYLIQQAHSFMEFVLNRFKTRPKVFISGMSMGGAVCFELSVRYPKDIAGVIFLGPAFRQIYGDRVLAKKLGSCLACLLPKASLVPQTFDDRTRFKMESVIKEDTQSYSGNHISGTTMCVLEAMRWISSNFKKFETPYIVFQGGVDKYVDPFGPLDLQRQCSSQDKTTIYYKNMWHEICHEPEYEQICQISSKWLKSRI